MGSGTQSFAVAEQQTALPREQSERTVRATNNTPRTHHPFSPDQCNGTFVLQ